jgi:hypothetical protein
MIDIWVRANRVMTRVNRERFRSPLSGRLYDFCTVQANALEVIDSRRVKMVDLVGIEPTTSSMPWKYQGRSILTAKDLRAGIVGKTGKIGAICYQFATKI